MPTYAVCGGTSYLPVFGTGKHPGNVRGNVRGNVQGICPGNMSYTRENLGPGVLAFKATQGHRDSHGSIGYL